MMIPIKPFDTYKWRWLSVAPTEGLLDPPVLLGVLRVLARHEGESPANPEISADLELVQKEIKTTVDLVRTPSRNLIRNSGQYWKGTGLLMPKHGVIQLSLLGRGLADGRITQGEFAAIMVQQTVLPNPWTYTVEEIEKWRKASLEIRPFVLILQIMEELGRNHGNGKSSFLTSHELIRVVIPMAGQKNPISEIANTLVQVRRGVLDISAWPDCAPAANDYRLAREFLLFLSNFGLCRRQIVTRKDDERYFLDELFDEASLTAAKTSIFTNDRDQGAVIEAVRHSALPSIIERQRIMTTVIKRPGQVKFRELVLRKYSGRCFLTGEEIPEVLEAAHIIPVRYGGADNPDNGICLRIDIHRLFDSGNIRIRPTGNLVFSDLVVGSRNYNCLPKMVPIPQFVNPHNFHWRDTYL